MIDAYTAMWYTGGNSINHRRTVHRSVGDRKQLLAGRLSDKMSSELGYYLGNSRVILFCGGYYGFRNF